MQKKIFLGNYVVSYSLRRSRRARRLRLSVSFDKGLEAVLPKFLPLCETEKFIRDKTDWIINRLNYFEKLKVKPYLLKGSRRDYLRLKCRAREIAKEKVARFSKIYNFRFNEIRIKNQRTRWGSCSKKGNLNFNYKIVLLPEKFANYLVVHELCHLAELNHSKIFWALVARTVPDYKKIVRQMKI